MKRMILATALLVAAGLLAFGAYEFHRRGQQDENGSRMNTLASILQASQAIDVEPAVLAKVGSEYTKLPSAYWLNDAWGRPFVIAAHLDSAGEYHFRVVSWGADGRPGPCTIGEGCKKRGVDWIIQDGNLQ